MKNTKSILRSVLFTFVLAFLFCSQVGAAKSIMDVKVLYKKTAAVEFIIPDRTYIEATYTGKQIKPEVELYYNGTLLKEGVDYQLGYGTNILPGGTGEIHALGLGEYTGSGTVSWFQIVNSKRLDVNYGDGRWAVTDVDDNGQYHQYMLTDAQYKQRKSNDYEENLALRGGSVAANKPAGSSSSTKPSTTTSKPSTTTSKPSKSAVTVKLSKTSYTYNGKAQKPKITVVCDGKTVASKNYSVQWKNNKAPGTAAVKITGKGSYRSKINVTKTFKICPKKTSIKNPSVGKGVYTVKWGKTAYASKYEVQLCTNKKFTKNNTKTVTVKGTSKKFTKLKKGQNYSCRVRAVKTDKNGTYYGPWSSVKSKKTK